MNPLRLNVGFIAHQPVGYSREFSFEYPYLFLRPDLELFSFSGKAVISRTPQGLLTRVHLQGATPAECVRCLWTFDQPLQVYFTELYAFTPRSISESDLLLPESGVIDLAPLAREYLILEIPISPLCTSECRGLCLICGDNLNESTCHHEVDSLDPRMAALKALLDE